MLIREFIYSKVQWPQDRYRLISSTFQFYPSFMMHLTQSSFVLVLKLLCWFLTFIEVFTFQLRKLTFEYACYLILSWHLIIYFHDLWFIFKLYQKLLLYVALILSYFYKTVNNKYHQNLYLWILFMNHGRVIKCRYFQKCSSF